MDKSKRSLRTRENLKRKNRQGLLRLSFFKANRSLSVQLIDDNKALTLLHESDRDIEGKRSDRARAMGERMASKILKLGLERLIFDKGGNRFHGVLRSFVEGLNSSKRLI